MIDRKELAPSIVNVALPALPLACVNFKFNALFTVPMTCLCIFAANSQALTTEDDNLSCFMEQERESYATRKSVRWSYQTLYMLCVGFLIRKVTLSRFTEQDKSKK